MRRLTANPFMALEPQFYRMCTSDKNCKCHALGSSHRLAKCSVTIDSSRPPQDSFVDVNEALIDFSLRSSHPLADGMAHTHFKVVHLSEWFPKAPGERVFCGAEDAPFYKLIRGVLDWGSFSKGHMSVLRCPGGQSLARSSPSRQ